MVCRKGALLMKTSGGLRPRMKYGQQRQYGKNVTPSSAINTANLEYCVDLVKKHDLENYLIGTLHIPREFRASYFAIHSFNIEVALIRSQGIAYL